jgi:uncharacterized small protein (DUF1192 family)
MKAQGEKKMTKDEIFYRIVSLRFEIDSYREARMFHKVAELRLEIARLQGILRFKKDSKVAS